MRVLNQFRAAIGKKRADVGRWDGDLKVGRVQVRQRVEIDGARRSLGGCDVRALTGTGRATRSCGIQVGLERYRGAGGRTDAQRPILLAADLQHGDVHHHFGLGSVQVAD